jgi:hypothetical protein
MRWMKRNWLTVVSIVVVAVLVWVTLKLLDVKTEADTVSAIAGAIAAVAAWLAARDSASAARDSELALGHATKPRIRVYAYVAGNRAVAMIWNDSPFPAGDLSYTCTREDGARHSDERGVLPPAPGSVPPDDPERRWDVLIGPPWVDDGSGNPRPLIRHAIRYSGQRGIMRWEYTDAVVAGSGSGWTQEITTDLPMR